jgi:hypothetical protein
MASRRPPRNNDGASARDLENFSKFGESILGQVLLEAEERERAGSKFEMDHGKPRDVLEAEERERAVRQGAANARRRTSDANASRLFEHAGAVERACLNFERDRGMPRGSANLEEVKACMLRGGQVFEIPPDGNCLFTAIAVAMHNFGNTDRWNDFVGCRCENKIYELRDDVATKATQMQKDPDFSERFALVHPDKTVDEYASDMRYLSRKLQVPLKSWGEEIALSLLVNIIQRPIQIFQTIDNDSNCIRFRHIYTFETADVVFDMLPPVKLLRDETGNHYDLLRDNVQPRGSGRGESSSGFMAGLLEEFKDTAKHLEQVERRERKEEKRAKRQKKMELDQGLQEARDHRKSMLAERVLALLAAADEDEDPGQLLDLLNRCAG